MIELLKLLIEINDNYIYYINENLKDKDNRFYVVTLKTNNRKILNRFLNVIDVYYIRDDMNYLIFKNITNVEINLIMKYLKYFYKELEDTYIDYNLYQVDCVKRKTKKLN